MVLVFKFLAHLFKTILRNPGPKTTFLLGLALVCKSLVVSPVPVPKVLVWNVTIFGLGTQVHKRLVKPSKTIETTHYCINKTILFICPLFIY